MEGEREARASEIYLNKCSHKGKKMSRMLGITEKAVSHYKTHFVEKINA